MVLIYLYQNHKFELGDHGFNQVNITIAFFDHIFQGSPGKKYSAFDSA